ncbi:MAG: hypothetical protein ACQSGP_08210 [Frankia sp.]
MAGEGVVAGGGAVGPHEAFEVRGRHGAGQGDEFGFVGGGRGAGQGADLGVRQATGQERLPGGGQDVERAGHPQVFVSRP